MPTISIEKQADPLQNMTAYLQFIDGAWRSGSDVAQSSVIDPATETPVGTVQHASRADLDDAVAAAAKGFVHWRSVQPFDRARVLRSAAALLRERVEAIAVCITCEQGKPLRESRAEVLASADILDWFAEEGRRAYGRVVQGRLPSQALQVHIEPVGPVAAFTPWNFPISQAARKVAAALAAGCSVVLKPSEEAPGGTIALVQSLADAGLPGGALNLVMGEPATISAHLIGSAVIRKISFTGSVAVGKHLAQLAASQMKPCTMELGGHAPVIVCEDADAAQVAQPITQHSRDPCQPRLVARAVNEKAGWRNASLARIAKLECNQCAAGSDSISAVFDDKDQQSSQKGGMPRIATVVNAPMTHESQTSFTSI